MQIFSAYPPDVVERLASPIVNNEADFVKATLDRQAGRVTELVAKPLLSILFPNLVRFSQPLSGMIASRKSLLKKVEFENDYGVGYRTAYQHASAGSKDFRSELRLH